MSIFVNDEEKREVRDHFFGYLSELNALDAFKSFGSLDEDLWYTDVVTEDIHRAIRKLDLDLRVLCGASRVVLTEYDYPFIIKFQPFSDLDNDNHYCEFEQEMYELAFKEGWGCYFCPVEKLGRFLFTVGDEVFARDIYVMPYCDCDEDAIIDESSSYQDRTNSNDDPEEDIALITLALAERCREMDLPLFLNFLREWGINDLHAGNWGYLDGRLVITDYAGYGNHECHF